MQPNLPWLTDPTVFRVNRLDAHSDHVCYGSAEQYESGETALRQVLDGTWRFHWSSCPGERPADFYRMDYDLSSFGTITVPGHMELQGCGQIQYINKLYPWDGHAELRPPEIDWENDPVGSYVTEFDLSPSLAEKEVCISFQGVEQAMYLYLNGQFVGYSEDSFTPSDFDLTPYIRPTGNRLCVEVYKRSSAAWIEDQDFFRFSGIFRSVYLYAKPTVEDLWLQSHLDENLTTGRLRIRLKLTRSARITCAVTHPKDGTLFEGTLELHQEGEYCFSQELAFPEVRLWDHGTPELYRILLTVRDENGELLELVPYDFGFRRFRLENGVMMLNGKRLILSGVNRHEWNPNTGRAITMEDMTAAMETFHRNNINAVRTSHYPNRSEWYHLCDQNGIYMMDETNMESHGSWQKDMTVDPTWNVPGCLPEWKECVLDRAKSMFERDKNHVSILFWSCGNESYAGSCILAMADWLRSMDPSRLVHYEGVFHNREFDAISDVESRMYATPDEIRDYLINGSGKPYLNCEYMHNMGNSLGGLESYIRLGEEFPQYQGGFLWDYMDQALWHTDACGNRVLGYGGDFGERLTDYAFSGNGIVTADGHEKPAMQEVRYWFSSPEARAEHDKHNEVAYSTIVPSEIPSSYPPLKITHGDGALGVKGGDFEILFSPLQGGPVSLVSHGQEWLWRVPKPTFWRAPTENDMGCGFPAKSAIWSAVDGYLQCTGMEIQEESEDSVSVQYTYSAAVMPDLAVSVCYCISRTGDLDVSVTYAGAAGRPQLPVFGLRFATPAPVSETLWLGLSGETYPDRKKGGVFGLHRETPHVPEYLVPQECGCHMDTHRTTFRLGDATLTVDQLEVPFAFSAIPYTPQQLEQAYHREELPAPCRTVISLYGAVRGVGGIDTWGNDVEKPYQIESDKDISFSFRMLL